MHRHQSRRACARSCSALSRTLVRAGFPAVLAHGLSGNGRVGNGLSGNGSLARAGFPAEAEIVHTRTDATVPSLAALPAAPGVCGRRGADVVLARSCNMQSAQSATAVALRRHCGRALRCAALGAVVSLGLRRRRGDRPIQRALNHCAAVGFALACRAGNGLAPNAPSARGLARCHGRSAVACRERAGLAGTLAQRRGRWT